MADNHAVAFERMSGCFGAINAADSLDVNSDSPMNYSPEAAAFILKEADKVMRNDEQDPILSSNACGMTLMMSRARMLAAQLCAILSARTLSMAHSRA